jgi:NAD-dependent dihydropyrimidine dehydrogenase PreA subunit
VIKVDQTLCSGCGACVDSCPVEAIQLVDQRAVIDDEACTQCEACRSACPNEAIIAVTVPVHSGAIPEPVPALAGTAWAEPAGRVDTPLARAAVSFRGSEIAPRLADVLMTTLESKLTQPAPATRSSPGRMARGRGERRQARRRGGCARYRNHRERR